MRFLSPSFIFPSGISISDTMDSNIEMALDYAAELHEDMCPDIIGLADSGGVRGMLLPRRPKKKKT